MSSFRTAYRCKHCGKVFRSLSAYSKDWYPALCILPMICRKCGIKDRPEYVSAKPKLFGLLGWNIKSEKPNWTDITHDKEVMDRVLKGVAEMQNDVLKKAEKIKKAMKNGPQQHEEDNPARHS